MKCRPEEIQFLYSNTIFTHRKLEIGHCPKCGKLLARLVEKRVTDGKIFETTYSKSKAQRLINECKDEIEYSSLDVPKTRKVLHGFRYGENREKINPKTGEKTIIQMACDFYGSKEKVKAIRINAIND